MDIAIILILGLVIFFILLSLFNFWFGSFHAIGRLYLFCCIVAVFLVEVFAIILPYIFTGAIILAGIILVLGIIASFMDRKKKPSIKEVNEPVIVNNANEIEPKKVVKRSIKPIARTNVDIIITDELLTKKIPLSRIINSITEIDMDKAMRLVERRDFRLFENLAPEEANMVIHKLYINHIQFELFER